MVSKQVKLRLALTKAIVNFFSQEDLYCDELQIQGTVCITADKNAIFVTQITETITDPDHAGSEAIREDDIDGQVAASQLPLSSVVLKEPLATSLKVKKSHSSAKQPYYKSKGTSDPNLPTAGFNHLMSSPSLSQVTLTASADIHSPSGAISNFHPFDPLSKFNYSDNIRNSLVVQEKLITDGKLGDAKNTDDCYSDDSENSLEGCVIVQPSRQNKHPAGAFSSAQPPANKKPKTDTNTPEDDQKVANQAALNLTKKSSASATNSSPRPPKTETWLTNRAMLPVNPILTPIFPGTPERQFALNPSIKQEIVDDVGGVDLRVATSPGNHGNHGLPGDMSKSEFPWLLASPPDGHALTDWPANSWVRKPKTKFSPEQLRSLEDAYQSDPFLSTCAERRAELARKLDLTEKNIQIWFQNQRRRRRAAAYSRLHYSAPDSVGSSVVDADQSSGNVEKDLEEEEIVEVREEDLDDEEEDGKNDAEHAAAAAAASDANSNVDGYRKTEAQNGIGTEEDPDHLMVTESNHGNHHGNVQGSSETVMSLLQGNNKNSPSGLPAT